MSLTSLTLNVSNAPSFRHSSTTTSAADTSSPATSKDFGSGRGLDFADVHFVLNFNMPPTPQSYTHHVGRTARAGKSGTALTLVSGDEEKALLSAIQESQPRLALAKSTDELEGLGSLQPAPLAFDLREVRSG